MEIHMLSLHILSALLVYPIKANNVTTTKVSVTANDENYDYFDYELTNNITDSESLIHPNPELFETKYAEDTVDVLPNVELPDDSLADADMHEHDFIDNIMYIYYGSHTKSGYTFGAEIIIIGSVLSCAAQLLTIICTLLRKESKHVTAKIFLNTMFCLCIANLIFMLGVHATKNSLRCEIIAVILHYMHLITSVWIFVCCYYIFKRFCNEYMPSFKYIYLLAYGIPAFIVLFCYGVSPNTYEIKKFCWVSVQKGMLLNYMLPVTILIITTTLISLNGIRKVNFELSKYELSSTDSIMTTIDLENKTKLFEKTSAVAHLDVQITNDNVDVCTISTERTDDEEEYLKFLYSCKKALKILSIVQTSYIVVWFIAVLALENAAYSSVMPIIYAVCNCILNWFIFVKSKHFAPQFKDIPQANESIIETFNENKIKSIQCMEKTTHTEISDNMPLLHGPDNFTELIELRTESISTINFPLSMST